MFFTQRFRALLCVLLCTAFVFASEQEAQKGSIVEREEGNATLAFATIDEADVSDLAGRSLEERGNENWFHLRAYGSNTRYQKAKGNWISFSEAGDATVTKNYGEAARFYQLGNYLIVGRRWVSFDFSNGYAIWKLSHRRPGHHSWRGWRDRWGWLHIGGWGGGRGGWGGFGSGWGEGVTCVSDDGSVFLEGDKHVPFRCKPIDLCHGQGPNQKPPPHPPNRPHPPYHTTKSHPPYYTTKPPPYKTTKSRPTYKTTKSRPTKYTKSTTTTTTTATTSATTTPTTTPTTTYTTTSSPTTPSSTMTTTKTTTTTSYTTATGTYSPTTSTTMNPSDYPDPTPHYKRYISEFEEGDDIFYEEVEE